MREEQNDTAQKVAPLINESKLQDTDSVLGLSFIPPEIGGKRSACEKCAIASVVLGGVSLVSWVIILIGIATSVAGIILSIFGLRSPQKRHAKIGLGLSIAGLLAAFVYAFAASYGLINSSFFTTQLF